GEEPYLAEVGAALSGHRPIPALRRLGVRFVLVERGNGVGVPYDIEERAIFDSGDLAVIDLGSPSAPPASVRDRPARVPVLAGDLLAAALMIGSVCAIRRKSG
ncbi:MAG TPA: hypothetical protein VF426_09865, partial [Marmoricola sp.]